MKGFQKLTLAAAIAAAPFTQAMEAMDDALLSEMTGQAGITIDVDLQMSIDAIKYVDSDGNSQLVSAATGQYDAAGVLKNAPGFDGTAGFDSTGTGTAETEADAVYAAGAQGAITMRGLQVGSIDSTTGRLIGTASIKGVTIDADGGDGLVIGIAQIGSANTGIDISVDSIQIHNGDAQAALLTATQGTGSVLGDMPGQSQEGYAISVAALTADATPTVSTDINTFLGTPAGTRTFADLTDEEREDFVTAVATDDAIGGGVYSSIASTSAYTDAVAAYGSEAYNAGVGTGNIGGLVIEDFRNYVEDSFVSTYNDRFDTALSNVSGNYIAAEIKINGTGDAVLGTGGLKIEAQIGGLMSKVALTMGEAASGETHEIGVKDLAFFNTADLNGDQIADTITAMKVNVDINVVDYTSSISNENVAALHLSNMEIEGSIVMGDIYLGTQGQGNDKSFGSVLIKDIDMTGTDVYIYGH